MSAGDDFKRPAAEAPAPFALHFLALALVMRSDLGNELVFAVLLLVGIGYVGPNWCVRHLHDCAAVQFVCSAAQQLTPIAWLLVTLHSQHDEVRLLAGFFLVSVPGVPGRWSGAWLVLWLACAGCRGSVRCTWGPALLLAGGLLGGGCPAGPRAGAAPPSAEPQLARGPDPDPQHGRPGLDRMVKCFPNWTPPTPKEVRAWTQVFDLPDKLLVVYACSVHLRLTHHGRLYLSTDHACFYGTAAAHALQFAVPLGDIEEVRYGGSRGAATLRFRGPVLLRGHQDRAKSLELRGCEDGSAALSALLSRHRGEAEEEEEEPEEPREPAPPSASAASTASAASAACAASAALDDGTPYQPFLDLTVPQLRLGTLAGELLASEWDEATLALALLLGGGGAALQISPWIDVDPSDALSSSSAVHVREVAAQVPVPPAPLCPETTRLTATYRISSTMSGGEYTSITLESSSISHDIPFGENFCVQDRIVFVPSDDCCGVRVTKEFRCVFLRSVGLLGSVIRSLASTAQSKSSEVLVSLLESRATIPAPCELDDVEESADDEKKPNARQTICSVQIWELQRRATLFHSDWHAPFLPHDGQKRWRWVDASFQRHPFTRLTSRDTVSDSEVPPVGPLQGWEPQGEWAIRRFASNEAHAEHGEANEGMEAPEGWQYAIDFYTDDWWWSPKPAGHHVRRRLWTRKFAKVTRPVQKKKGTSPGA
mmetsp:Transcript_84879/g.240541  ORF Transcript_84879/g.240541 Transcript_84879/m.240541 type:complete len:711 (+) Transcript_84879:103-2235(+)